MEIKLIPQINGTASLDELKKNSQVSGRICYTEKDIDGLFEEPYDAKLVEGRLLPSGHHSPFEHKHLTFYMKGIPKILAMVLNNERPYVTSEKSARYTTMKDIIPEQKELYDKWLEILEQEIARVYPESQFPRLHIRDKSNKNGITKLAQENARYMTSVFTPTKMVHTLEARQVNFLIDEFQKYISEKSNSQSEFERRLSQIMPEFIDQMQPFQIENLENKTDRHLSMFRETPVEEYFGDVYATNYLLSFAGLAQAHRHRTLDYTMVTPQLNGGNDKGFFVPEVIRRAGLSDEWYNDLTKVASNDFPQAQLLYVTERGKIEDFRSKCILRLCSHAQYEIMQNTKATAEKYSRYRQEILDWIKPKCMQGNKCAEPCAVGSNMALERIV